MNTESLEEKLQKAVSTVQSEKENGKETDPLKAWLSSREPQVNPDALLALVEELKAQPGLSIFDGKMQVLENSRHSIIYGLHVIPRSALIRTLQHPRIHLDSEDESSKNTYNWRREFEDARLCLTLIGPLILSWVGIMAHSCGLGPL